uniref:Putative ovule protein n=1 Tax=Solanum chacoense TaxID=4108 RepID=A0A0V0HAT4_SOLCH
MPITWELLGSYLCFHRNSLAPFHNSISSTAKGLGTYHFANNQFVLAGVGGGYRALEGIQLIELVLMYSMLNCVTQLV